MQIKLLLLLYQNKNKGHKNMGFVGDYVRGYMDWFYSTPGGKAVGVLQGLWLESEVGIEPVADGDLPSWYQDKTPPKIKEDLPKPITEQPSVEIELPDLSLDVQYSPITNNSIQVFNTQNNNYYNIVLAPQIPNTVNIPPRRLPKEANGQTAFDTPNGKPITIQKSLTERKYGELICRPLNRKSHKFKLSKSKNFNALLKETSKKGQQDFVDWLESQFSGSIEKFASNFIEGNEKDGEGKNHPYMAFWDFDAISKNKKKGLFDSGGRKEHQGELWNASALVTADLIKGFQGEIGLMFGQNTLHLIAKEYSHQSINAYQEVSGLIPLEYEIVDNEYTLENEYKSMTSMLVNSSNGLIPKIYNILGGSVWDSQMFKQGEVSIEGWIRAAGETQFEDGKENNKVKLKNLPDLIRHFIATDYYRAGHHRFPAKMPQWLLDIEGEKDKDKNDVLISDSLHLHEWTLRQFDAIMGQFPIKIKYKNNKGEEKDLSVENIAEILSELLGLTISIASDANTLIGIGMKNLVETTKASNSAIVASDYAKANADYMGYRIKEYTRKLPLSFTPKAETLKEALENSEQKTVGYKYDGKEELQDQLNKLLFICQIIKAANFIPWKPGQKLTGDWIKDLVKNGSETEKKDWEEFIKRVNAPDGVYKTKNNAQPKIDEINKNPE